MVNQLAMFLGEYVHTLDPKKRLSLPVKFRRGVGKKVVVTKGLDNCLFVYSQKSWRKISEKLGDLSIGQADQRGFNRFLLSGAVEIDVDSVGRILIPDFLKNFASLKGRVIVSGVGDRIEIWNERTWNEYKKRIEKQADAMAEKLGNLGAI